MTIYELTVRLSVEVEEAMGALGQLSQRLDDVVRRALEASSRMQITGKASVDVSGAIASLNQLIRAAASAQSILGRVSASRARQWDGEESGESVRSTDDPARQEQIRQDYELIAHKRRMNQITLEEELAMLEELRQKHQLTADEIMDWEERVHDVRQDMRRQEEDDLNRLTQSVQSALKEKYQTMRDTELNRLNNSRQAWLNWRDDSLGAIDDQISALDRLEEAQQREEQDEKELRNIEKLRQDVAYEQDDYNRQMLERQLEEAIAQREERLRAQETEDRRAALRKEADDIRAQAQQRIDALEREADAVQEAYAALTDPDNLKTEAQQLVLSGDQQQILSLLSEFTPHYDALGRTMGEKLLDGFRAAVGDLSGWFDQLAMGMETAQNQLAGAQEMAYSRSSPTGRAAERGVSVQQTVHFHQQVESPGDVARRMDAVNQALGVLMSQEG